MIRNRKDIGENVGNEINLTQRLKYDLERWKMLWKAEENTCYQHFLLFPYCFQKHFSSVPKMFSKDLLHMVVNYQVCLVKATISNLTKMAESYPNG